MYEKRDKPLNRILLRHGKVCRIEEWVLRREHWWQDWNLVERLLITSDEAGFEFSCNMTSIWIEPFRRFSTRDGWKDGAEDVIREALPSSEAERVVEAMTSQYGWGHFETD